MNKNDKFIMQCADCNLKYKKSLKWLENVEEFQCSCGNILDVYEVVNDIFMDKKHPKEIYVAYQK